MSGTSSTIIPVYKVPTLNLVTATVHQPTRTAAALHTEAGPESAVEIKLAAM